MRYKNLSLYSLLFVLVVTLLSIPPKKMHRFRASLVAKTLKIQSKFLTEERQKLTFTLHKLEEENATLKHLIANVDLSKHYQMATVIFRDPAFWSSSVLIDKGLQDPDFPIERNSPVLSNGYLIGIVEEVCETFSKVRLITDKNLQFSIRKETVIDSENLELGTLFGIASIDNRYRFKQVEGVFFSKNISEGDLLVTSGYDGVFPEGIPVARVTEVSIDQDQISYPFRATIAAPDIKYLKFVTVLKPLTSQL